jgi:hypothetical protein
MHKILNISNGRKKYEIIALVLLATWITYYLFILINTGFMSDDAYNSQIKGAIIQQGITLNERILAEIYGWAQGAGRLLVFDWYMTYGLYYFTQDTVTVKALTIFIILSGILFFYFFSKRETNSSCLALLACLIIPIFFQFRLWHDPILAFTFLIPIVFTLTMGALVLFQHYLDHGRSRYYIFAACLYLMAVLTYEAAYPLCLLFFIIANERSNNVIRAFKQSAGFTIPLAVIITTLTAYRIYFIKSSTYPGAELHLELGKLMSAFAIQVSSSIPLSYYFFNKENLDTQLYKVDYLFLVLFGLGVATLIHTIGKSTIVPKFRSWATSGIILLLIPATLSSLSGHQEELNLAGYGFGYITVYIQYFGLCILSLWLITIIARKAKGKWFTVLVFMVSVGSTFVAAANLKLNRAVALKSNETYKYPRQLLKSALQAGLADEMKDGDFLFRTMRYPSDWMWFYTTVTGKKIETCELSDTDGYKTCVKKIHQNEFLGNDFRHKVGRSFESLDQSMQPTWIMSYNFDKKNGEVGRVILGKVDMITQDAQSITPIQIFVKKVSVYDLAQNNIKKYNFETLPINFMRLIENQTEDITETAKFNQFTLQPTDVEFEWKGSTYAREGSSASNLRWSSGSATLKLYNLTEEPRWVDVKMDLGTPTTPPSKISVKYADKMELITLNQPRTSYSKQLLLAPGLTEIIFTSDAKPIQNGDPRNIVFGIFDFTLAQVSK